ncbi:hypothetical protein SLA2020_449500 [Shorea laevis]
MGCSTSKLDDEEAVQLCKDRKRFIKQAVEQRRRFASGHIAYIQSLKRVSAALRDYVEGDEPHEFFLDSFITPPFTPIKKTSPSFITIHSQPNSCLKVNYLRSGGEPDVLVEERPPQSPETVRVETYSPRHHFGIDGFFAMQSSPMSSSFFSYSPNNRPNIPPPSPPTSQWDFFWNPFSSLDYYGHDQTAMDDDIREDIVEGIDEGEDEDEEEETDSGTETEHPVKGSLQSHRASTGISKAQEMEVGDQEEAKEETPGFTVYVNQRPTSMAEVVKDLETQFMIVCNSANEVSALLEASRVQYASTSNEITAMKMLNPVALFRSASSRSSSSRFLANSSSTRDEGYESSSDFSEEPCMSSGSHQSTMDRLYAWEKKLYDEVKSGERVRISYEKKCKQLRNQDVKGDDPSAVDKTRLAIRDLHTQIKVSIHSVEAVSKRIETLRDEELQPQLLELAKGLARMWKVMAECHQSQKRTLDEAKLLLARMPSKLDAKKHSSMSITEPQRVARSAANLETELRNWRACFESWITSQRSYVHALTGWLLRCVQSDPDTSKVPCSPRRSSGTLPIFGLCVQWSKFLDAIRETPVLDGLDFFAAGMGSLYAQQVEEVIMTAEKMAEVAIRVLCAGMSVAMSSLTEFSVGSAEGYAVLVKQWEDTHVADTSCSTDL